MIIDNVNPQLGQQLAIYCERDLHIFIEKLATFSYNLIQENICAPKCMIYKHSHAFISKKISFFNAIFMNVLLESPDCSIRVQYIDDCSIRVFRF